jgi:myo-inositol-1(or 4)-monophosphatase
MRTLPSHDVDQTNTTWSNEKAVGVDANDLAAVLRLFGVICDGAAALLAGNSDWSLSGERATQYSVDVEIDDFCLQMLHGEGFAVLSEESGITAPSGHRNSASIVVVDPLDGSTNASLGLPWCATSLCLVTDGVPVVSMVSNLRTGTRFAAIRGRGATQDGHPIETTSSATTLREAIIAVNARPPAEFRPAQYRSMGASALDIASVAGRWGFDGSIDFDDDKIGVWDYLAAVSIVREAGGVAADALGRELVTLDPTARRRPVVAATQELLDELLAVATTRS